MRPLRFPFRRRRGISRHPVRRLLSGVLAGLALTTAAIFWLNSQLRPLVLSASETMLSRRVTQIVSGVLAQEDVSDQLSYSELVELEYDQSGQLVAVTTRTEVANRLLAELNVRLLEALEVLQTETISIPAGSLTGLTILAGHGFEIPVRVRGVSGLDGHWDSSLTAAGINQTVHRIDLVIASDLVLLLPGGPCTHTVSTRVTVAETVLLGEVPEYYTYFSQFDSAAEAADAYADYGAGKGY